MTHQYKKLPVTMKMWMQFNVMALTSLGVDAVITSCHVELVVCELHSFIPVFFENHTTVSMNDVTH